MPPSIFHLALFHLASDTFAIAIPPLATTVNQIPADISAEIACEIVATFLASHDNPQLRVVVVDEKQETIEAFQRVCVLFFFPFENDVDIGV